MTAPADSSIPTKDLFTDHFFFFLFIILLLIIAIKGVCSEGIKMKIVFHF